MKKTHLLQLIKVKAVNANFKDGGENEPEINRSFGNAGTEDFKEGGTTFFKKLFLEIKDPYLRKCKTTIALLFTKCYCM
jgi:hypothetical protein